MQAAANRFVLAFVASAVLLLAPAVLLSVYLGPVSGDVARVGHFAHRDFGALAPQASINRLPPPGTAVAAGEVLLLGDSFSLSNLWQSELTRTTGRGVTTWNFKRVGCTGDWIEKAIAGALRAGVRTVVVETVERELHVRFDDPPGCARDYYPRWDVPVDVAGEPSRWHGIFPMDIGYLSATALQYLQTRDIAGRYRSGEVVSVDLVRNDLFSNRQPHRLLYYAHDERKFERWSEADASALLDRMVAWRDRAKSAGVQLHFLVIPDKSSVYWPYIKPEQRLPYPEKGERLFALIGEKLGAEYNLLPYLREQAALQPDLYAPNDSHFSARGFRLLAARVAGWMAAAALPVRDARSSGT